jgi:hypothetical protein
MHRFQIQNLQFCEQAWVVCIKCKFRRQSYDREIQLFDAPGSLHSALQIKKKYFSMSSLLQRWGRFSKRGLGANLRLVDNT